MAEITVTFEDGMAERLPAGITAAEAMRRHAGRDGGRARLERAVAARVEADGSTVVDLTRPLLRDCRVAPVAVETPEGLEVIRHSTAHLMAQAVKRLFPETQITIGPVIENGFYYDFKRPGGFASEDLPRIEETMRAIVAEDLPVRREEVARGEAVRRFREMGEHYKVEIIEGIPDDVVSLYHQGEFVDLCRGPHVPSTGRIPAFRLTSLAGAYWRGDARNEQLQRIYGTAWASEQDLEAYLKRLEEAKQRDHRRLGQVLDLYSLHPIAPGSPFFHAKGAVVYNTLVGYIRGLYARYGYTEVITPLIYKTELWKTSGHYDAFRDDMFLMTIEDEEYGVKPMNCPGHCYLFATRKHSYRDLPIRYADFSRLHRFEPSGTLAGLVRVRSMAQDDAHIYCAPEQLDGELERFIAMTREVYGAFGFDRVEVTLQTRPEKFLGRLELWEAAEAAVLGALERFIAILLEHTAGKLPLWLAPVQVRVLPVSEKAAAYATRVADACGAAGLRAEADLRNEKLGYKVREAQVEKVPVVAVVGEREAAAGTVAPRTEGAAQAAVALDAFVAATAAEARMPGGVA